MAIQFPRVPTIAVDDPITSTQHNKLAAAFNARILSGIGDFTWRFSLWTANLVSQIRNPKETGVEGALLWPPVDEWLQVYSHIPWSNDTVIWPDDIPPGAEEGVSLSNPLGAFVFGARWADLFDEVTRVDDPVGSYNPLATDLDPIDAWQNGKVHRGGYDPNNGFASAPSIDAAISLYNIGYPGRSYYLKTYGGFFQQPDPVPGQDCQDSTSSVGPNPLFTIRFTPLAQFAGTHPVRTFQCCCSERSPLIPAGGCPASGPIPDNTVLAGYSKTRDWFLLLMWTQDIDGVWYPFVCEVLSRSVYIEGPYSSGGYLARDDGRQQDAMIHEWSKSFRGADYQRPADGEFEIQEIGFDFQQFLDRPYLLAPARGTYNSTTQDVDVVYPSWELTANSPAGTLLTGPPHVINSNMIMAGWIINGSGIAAPVTVELLRDGVVVARREVTPESWSRVDWFPNPDLGGTITARLATDLTLVTDGTLKVEIAELVAYRPQIQDAYFLLRIMSGTGRAPDDGDDFGEWFDRAKRVSDKYFTDGCLSGSGLTVVDHIQRSVMHEAARKVLRRNYRLAGRNLLRTYHVNAEGKSVLEFARYTVLQTQDMDVWDGMAPELDNAIGSGQLVFGREYKAFGGSIDYGGATYPVDAKFTATWANGKEYAGPGVAMENQLIVRTPPLGGKTNRWTLTLSTNVYHPSESSLWKPDNYDISIRLNNRCHLYSEDIPASSELNWHFAYGQTPNTLWSEATPGHTYAKGLKPNHADDVVRRKYYCACKIYPPPTEVEKIEAVVVGTEQRVRVTLTGRLANRTGDWYPTNPDVATWTQGPISQYEIDSYRTDENAVITYLYHLSSGINFPVLLGDYALNRGLSVPEIPDNPYGSYFPRFNFVRLLEEVSEDNNEEIDPADQMLDVDFMTDCATYLRVMCEGYVDRVMTGQFACDDTGSNAVDFSFEQLMFQASDERYSEFPMLPDTARADSRGVGSVGLLPNTICYADAYNLLANAVNLLFIARLELPIKSRYKLSTSSNTQPIAPTGGQEDCDAIGGNWFDNVQATQGGTVEGTPEWSEWAPGSGNIGGSVTAGYAIMNDPPCRLYGWRDQLDWEIAPADDGSDCALSPDLLALLSGGFTGAFGYRTFKDAACTERVVAASQEDSEVCDFSNLSFRPFFDGVNYYKWIGEFPPEETKCEFVESGSLTGVDAPQGCDLSHCKFPASGGNPAGWLGSSIVTRVTFNVAVNLVPVIVVPVV
jgi:hypothetical protein